MSTLTTAHLVREWGAGGAGIGLYFVLYFVVICVQKLLKMSITVPVLEACTLARDYSVTREMLQ